MRIVKVVTSTVRGAPAGQWLETMESGDMGDETVFVHEVQMHKGKGSGTRGSPDLTSSGPVIRVYPNQSMILVDGGEMVDHTAEEGYCAIDHPSTPSAFNGQFGGALEESFSRIRSGSMIPGTQKVYYIDLQEIEEIEFGTRNPINYFDSFCSAGLFLRAHGIYSVKVTDPLKSYVKVTPKSANKVEIDPANEQHLSELLEASQISVDQVFANGIRTSFVASKDRGLGRYMADTPGEGRNKLGGVEIQAVDIASVTYDEESQNPIDLRNRGATMRDPGIREEYARSIIAEGLKNTGGNSAGSLADFMGVGFGMQTGGDFMEATSSANMQQMQINQAGQIQGNDGDQSMGNQGTGARTMGAPTMEIPTMETPTAGAQLMGSMASSVRSEPGSWYYTDCGTANTGKFYGECGNPRPVGRWIYSCGTINTGKSCSGCGKPRPQVDLAASHIILTGDNRWEL